MMVTSDGSRRGHGGVTGADDGHRALNLHTKVAGITYVKMAYQLHRLPGPFALLDTLVQVGHIPARDDRSRPR